jgi:hypothetical protein
MSSREANRLWALKRKGYVERTTEPEPWSSYWILTDAGKEVARPHAVKAALLDL